MPERARFGWIETVPPEQAEGLLAKLYKAAIDRAGKVFNVIRIQSLRPPTLRLSTLLYREVMFGERSPLSRAQREMIATAVSRANACEY
jgi:alkylhydroperoxidase family enzyme